MNVAAALRAVANHVADTADDDHRLALMESLAAVAFAMHVASGDDQREVNAIAVEAALFVHLSRSAEEQQLKFRELLQGGARA